ncbi:MULTISPECIES: hypothetical protein [unclassified Janthinobacterium]|uniref:hypothetical protein n=1 Tax=unclassified Janthinobacterium TaxID=2610881 RepID=UPI00088EB55E|nr:MULTISPECIES: hypothetical protein [unclassified Janthinobacterium]SDA78795.1 hypothetical protein SAMN03159349_04514 [Janthinobacterium sp. 551a]SFB62668.1 hypothetical protein SAMN03159300_110160 [Janthinobacterium sp. 344]
MARLSWTVLLCACAALPAQAGENVVIVTPAKTEGAQGGCTAVDSAGQRVQSMSCLNEKLLPAGDLARRPPPALSTAETNLQRPSNQLGLYNRAALEHRMGNAFGKSVTPQRPPPPTPASPLLPPR